MLRLNKSNMEGVLWNASTGTGYALNDTKCPLMDVGMLVTDNQIYANVSVDGHPSKLRFDIDADNGKMAAVFLRELFHWQWHMAQPPRRTFQQSDSIWNTHPRPMTTCARSVNLRLYIASKHLFAAGAKN